MESIVDNPASTMASFDRQFQLNQIGQEAVAWGWGFEVGDRMFHIVQAYTKGASTRT